MMRDLEALAPLCEFAEGQWGLVTAEQLAAALGDGGVGVLQAAGVIEAVIEDVWRVRAGAQHPMPRSYARWLRLSPQPAWQRIAPQCGVVSHASAARLYRLAAVGPVGSLLDISVPPQAPPLAESDEVRVRHADLADEEFTDLHGLPVTTPGRTLADLLAERPAEVVELGTLAAGFLAHGWADHADLAAGLSRSGQDSAHLATLLAAAEE